MRKSSVHSIRQSQASSFSSQASNAQFNAKLEEKKREYDALRALERLSQEYVRRLEAIDLDCNVMGDAGKVHGDVLSQWPEMFRILIPQLPTSTKSDDAGSQDIVPQTCERLVRVPVEELQQRESTKL
ncbi:uncharacterized protein FOMMEDRAFT_85190 [Fomitiporia mediterranea MF3/22]|uniref:uncharacterized protein n=1 Tax=Fomitiporia mediterranea (strain MF3/22) TaxID=694068 RepID=UPI0004408ADB|nr:uncharacterized protein FOMMEDRAFT_85190 [Fomitiporia mediterranea MF3/22]EJD03328.1 hypothetical protein FOMMEDRAFT_85190 [Fomitiporia mediterranea MF3/22]